MEERYTRNIGSLTEKEQEIINTKKVLVAGCGGLGGYVIEYLVRSGVKQLTVCDGDVFDVSNLNRQLNATELSLGKSKALAAKERVLTINSKADVTAVNGLITEENADSLVEGCDIVIDALDNVESRIVLEKACERAGVPFVFGGVSGWYGSVSTVYPGDRTIEKMYSGFPKPKSPSVICPAVASIAAFEVAEALKVMLGGGDLRKKMLMVNLKQLGMRVVDL